MSFHLDKEVSKALQVPLLDTYALFLVLVWSQFVLTLLRCTTSLSRLVSLVALVSLVSLSVSNALPPYFTEFFYHLNSITFSLKLPLSKSGTYISPKLKEVTQLCKYKHELSTLNPVFLSVAPQVIPDSSLLHLTVLVDAANSHNNVLNIDPIADHVVTIQ